MDVGIGFINTHNMHILLYHFYSRTPNPVYQEIAANLRILGHTVWLGSRNEADDLAWHDGEKIVAVVPGPPAVANGKLDKLTANLRNLAYMIRVSRFVTKTAPDVFQANVNNLGWLLPLLKNGKTCYLYDIRQINEAVNRSMKQRIMEKRTVWTMKLCARYLYQHTFFCHAEAAKKILGERWADRSSVIPVGIDQKFLDWETNKEEVTDSAIVSESTSHHQNRAAKVRFLYVGTLSRLRNLDKLIHAAQAVATKSQDFQLDLVGPDTSNGYYQNLVTELALDHLVQVKPPVAYHDVPKIMSTYDVGLAYVPDRPTWHYQPTIKVLEYRALGIPIISTDVATHREIVEENKNGLLVADSAEALANGMMRYVSDEQFLQSCQTNAIAMRRGITWLEVAKMYATVYEQVLDHV